MWATIASITTMNLNATQEIREKASDQLIENPQDSTVQQRLLNELITLVCTWSWSVPSGHSEGTRYGHTNNNAITIRSISEVRR